LDIPPDYKDDALWKVAQDGKTFLTIRGDFL
jgi:hypothetical protein